ncbi:MAG: T9SS type A sorting domain-containing protein [Crocinitomicaceae bacterium]|nr:T9SS type A sorting domain-containing protein [Crocinitomicaceae bacterium]
MKKLSTLLFGVLLAAAGQSQTTVYTTGQTYADAWTGWSTPVTTGTTSQSINGANIYTFSGMASTAFTIEIYRQFTINTSDMDLYLGATTQNATVSVWISADNVSYTQIGSQVFGAGFATSTIVIPTVNPPSTTFYLKLRMVGTFASPAQSNFNNLKIDAVLSSTNSVSISPLTTQNILTSTNGTVLTATEAPSAATSREWKYSTTSGSGYVSFSSAQTGTTYTPNFATAGTYYVVCVSNFSGDSQTSNQVQINVSAPASLEDFTIGANVRYTNGMLNVVTPIQNYNVQIFDINGQLIISEQNLKSFDFAGNNPGIYFVSFYYNGERKTLKIAHMN